MPNYPAPTPIAPGFVWQQNITSLAERVVEVRSFDIQNDGTELLWGLPGLHNWWELTGAASMSDWVWGPVAVAPGGGS